MHHKSFIQNGVTSITLGTLFFFVVFPIHIINPFDVDWIFHKPSTQYLGIDLHPYYLGWKFFRHAAWTFPIGSINDFVYPLNTYLAYTDSIPLVAIILKPFSSLLPANFQYLGLWVFLCCILQNFFALKILRKWIQDPVSLILATALVAWSPVLVWRANHVALVSQWLLLWAIGLVADQYWDQQNSAPKGKTLAEPMLLIGLATSIQPYLAAMTLGICWALPLSEFLQTSSLKGTNKFKNIFRLISASIQLALPMLLVLYALGFMNGESQGEGFHWFASDLLGFLNNHFTSFIVPSFPRKAGLHEGYAWPGLGVWFLIGSVIYTYEKHKIPQLQLSHCWRALCIATGIMFFFALGERIFVGTFWLIDMEWFWSALSFVTRSFRSCGRFVWPLYYILIMGFLVTVTKTQSVSRSRKFFVASLILQAIDMGPWYFDHSKRFPTGNRMPWTQNLWEQEIKNMRHIHLIPPSIENGPCERQPQDQWYEWPEFANLAAEHGLTINSGYLARYDRTLTQTHCVSQTNQFAVGPLAQDTLYIVRLGYEDKVPIAGMDRACKIIDGFTSCKAQNSL